MNEILSMSQIMNTTLKVFSNNDPQQLKYTMQLKQWTEQYIKIFVDFKYPELTSVGIKNDILNL